MFKKLFLFLFFFTISSFSQKNGINLVFNKKLQKKTLELKTTSNFKKAYHFFVNQKWDSTLVYTMKELSKTKNQETKDYCHHLRAYSFSKLNLFEQSQKELRLVSSKYQFYVLIDKFWADCFLELNQFEKALFYYKKIEKSPDYNKFGIIAWGLFENIGLCHLHLNQLDESEEYLIKSKGLQEKANVSKETLINLYTNIANLYYSQYKDKQAIFYFEKAYLLSKETNLFLLKKNAAANMSVVEENKKNHSKALFYSKEAGRWKDSINNQNKIWAVAEYEKKFAIAEKQKEIKILEVENQLKNTQRNWSFFVAFLLLFFITIGSYVYAQKVRNSRIISRQKEKLDALNTSKDQLFSVVSHDLRSSVNALKISNTKLTNSLETKNYNELEQLVSQNSNIANGTYNLLDNLLHWALLQTKQLYFNKESVHLHSIVQQIEYNYKPLLADKSIDFENNVSKNNFIFVDLDSLKIVLRNLLDNAIKFSNENGKIHFYTQDIKGDFCKLIIEDTGLGMSENTIKELLADNELLAKKSNSEIIGTGLGMQLCKQMIKKNSGKLNIESELSKGTKMIISLPKTK